MLAVGCPHLPCQPHLHSWTWLTLPTNCLQMIKDTVCTIMTERRDMAQALHDTNYIVRP
jgi:hypothetical protein